MSGVARAHLERLYARTPDPWAFRTSSYEAEKRAATVAALGGRRYRSLLELGCSIGTLGAELAAHADAYTGVDAVPGAIAAARRAIPHGRFATLYLPARLPDGDHDLIVVSEILYFFDRAGLSALAVEIAGRWPCAEVLAVNYLGDTGNPLSGLEALAAFADALPSHRREPVAETQGYRIDRFVPSATHDDRSARRRTMIVPRGDAR